MKCSFSFTCKSGKTGFVWKVLICFKNTHCWVFWQLLSGAYFAGLGTRIGWCDMKTANNSILHKVLCSKKKCYTTFLWCGALNKSECLNSRPRAGRKETDW